MMKRITAAEGRTPQYRYLIESSQAPMMSVLSVGSSRAVRLKYLVAVKEGGMPVAVAGQAAAVNAIKVLTKVGRGALRPVHHAQVPGARLEHLAPSPFCGLCPPERSPSPT